MPDIAGQMAADNSYGQNRYEHRHHIFRSDVYQPEQADMQPGCYAAPLIWPVATPADRGDNLGTSCCNGQKMPVGKPCKRNRPDKPSKQHT